MFSWLLMVGIQALELCVDGAPPSGAAGLNRIHQGYSERSVTAGSALAAFPAGTRPATSATDINSAGASIHEITSPPVMPNNRLCRARPTSHERVNPINEPQRASLPA